MVNVVPQSPKVNRKLWIKSEKYERLVSTQLGSVNVINGVVYDDNPKRIGKNQISILKGMWKMIWNDDKDFKKCFYYTNDLDVVVKGDKLKHHRINFEKLHK